MSNVVYEIDWDALDEENRWYAYLQEMTERRKKGEEDGGDEKRE